MFKKLFAKKPKPAPKPEVECPLSVGDKVVLTDNVMYEVKKIGEKSEYPNYWTSQGKAIVTLPDKATNVSKPTPVISGKYGLTGYYVTYDLPNNLGNLVKFDNKWSHSHTDDYDRELYVTMNIDEVEIVS